MSSMESLESQVQALGLGHLNYVIGDPEASKPYALVIAKKAELWTTFYVDERGLVEEQSVRLTVIRRQRARISFASCETWHESRRSMPSWQPAAGPLGRVDELVQWPERRSSCVRGMEDAGRRRDRTTLKSPKRAT